MSQKHDYGRSFLYAEDLISGGQFQSVHLEISAYHEPNTIMAANGKLVDKPIIEFAGKTKMLALCKTNISILKIVLGEQDGTKWIGKKITLGARVVEAFGEPTLALRVLPPKGTVLRQSLKQRLGKKAEIAPPQ